MGASYRITRQTATAYPVAGVLSLGITGLGGAETALISGNMGLP